MLLVTVDKYNEQSRYSNVTLRHTLHNTAVLG
jgi:hypothetical protein